MERAIEHPGAAVERHPRHTPPQVRESREEILASGKPFPHYEDMVIDELTNDEEAQFLAAIAGA